jgi:glutamine synthetase
LNGIECEWTLRKALGSEGAKPDPLPGSLNEALDKLDDKYLMLIVGPKLSKGYLALRRQEAKRASETEFEDEVKEFPARL